MEVGEVIYGYDPVLESGKDGMCDIVDIGMNHL